MKPAMSKVLGLIPSTKRNKEKNAIKPAGKAQHMLAHGWAPHKCVSCSIPVIKCKADVVISYLKRARWGLPKATQSSTKEEAETSVFCLSDLFALSDSIAIREERVCRDLCLLAAQIIKHAPFQRRCQQIIHSLTLSSPLGYSKGNSVWSSKLTFTSTVSSSRWHRRNQGGRGSSRLPSYREKHRVVQQSSFSVDIE